MINPSEEQEFEEYLRQLDAREGDIEEDLDQDSVVGPCLLCGDWCAFNNPCCDYGVNVEGLNRDPGSEGILGECV